MMEKDTSLNDGMDADGVADENSGSGNATVTWCRDFVKTELGETGRVDPKSAWRIIYKAIMWTEEAHDSGKTEVIPHIIDRDRMLADGGKPRRGRTKRNLEAGEAEAAGVWYPKAMSVGQMLKSEFGRWRPPASLYVLFRPSGDMPRGTPIWSPPRFPRSSKLWAS
jgi:hypothetical protein